MNPINRKPVTMCLHIFISLGVSHGTQAPELDIYRSVLQCFGNAGDFDGVDYVWQHLALIAVLSAACFERLGQLQP